MMKRRETRTVDIGGVKIGSGYPIAIQSMAKTDTHDISSTVGEVLRLEKAGCEIVRVAVKTKEAARAICEIKKEITIPLVADIHFDYKLALEAVRNGADKIRINPGNMKDEGDLERIIDVCEEKSIPIRVGINSGSLMEMHTGRADPDEIMVKSMSEYLEYFNKRGFSDIVISLKSSDIRVVIGAYRKMAVRCDHPFHLGVTAAGLPEDGIVKSSIGIGALLLDGIGDTIRVSLTGDPVSEIYPAQSMLQSTGSRTFGPEIIACPTCGRCQVDLVSIVEELKARVMSNRSWVGKKPLIIAVMGCEVNGPGEAKAADVGIAFGKNKGVIFRKGEILKTVAAEDAVEELLKII